MGKERTGYSRMKNFALHLCVCVCVCVWWGRLFLLLGFGLDSYSLNLYLSGGEPYKIVKLFAFLISFAPLAVFVALLYKYLPFDPLPQRNPKKNGDSA